MGVLDYVPDFNLQDWWVFWFDGKVSHLILLVFSLLLIEVWGCNDVFYVHKFFILQDFASWTFKLRTGFGVLVWSVRVELSSTNDSRLWHFSEIFLGHLVCLIWLLGCKIVCMSWQGAFLPLVVCSVVGFYQGFSVVPKKFKSLRCRDWIFLDPCFGMLLPGLLMKKLEMPQQLIQCGRSRSCRLPSWKVPM